MAEAGTIFVGHVAAGWAVHVARERSDAPDLGRTFAIERRAWRYAERLKRERGWPVIWARAVQAPERGMRHG